MATPQHPDRIVLHIAGADRPGVTARLTEINPTDRPYHFGWVLEAWCGREDAVGDA